MNIPLFPLNLVLLPQEEIPLHIFEPQYKKLITQCIKTNKHFGVILTTKTKKYKVGCTAEIIDVLAKYESGEYDIIIKGNQKFNLYNIKKEKGLWIGDIYYINDNKTVVSSKLIENVQNKYINILLNHKMDKDIENQMKKYISYDFTKKIILPVRLKQMFLELHNETQRLAFLQKLFKKVINSKTSKYLDNLN